MTKKITYLGSKYWADTVIDGITANDFDFNEMVKETVIKKESLCPCGKYGTKITFQHEGRLYTFNYLTGYPCECDS